MRLLDEIAEESVEKATRCPVGLMLRDMDDAGREELQEALDSPHPAVLIGKVLRKRGHELSDRSIQNHRRTSCSCKS